MGIVALSSALVFGGSSNSYADDSVTAQVSVDVRSVISIMAEDITIDISSPSPSGVFATGTGQVTVNTNTPHGYSVFLTSDSTSSTTLDHESVETSKINSIASAETISGSTTKFSTNNTWGWSNDGVVFYPIRAKGTMDNGARKTRYRETNEASPAGDTSTLTIGATVDSRISSGVYTGTLLLTAIPNDNGMICEYMSGCDE